MSERVSGQQQDDDRLLKPATAHGTPTRGPPRAAEGRVRSRRPVGQPATDCSCSCSLLFASLPRGGAPRATQHNTTQQHTTPKKEKSSVFRADREKERGRRAAATGVRRRGSPLQCERRAGPECGRRERLCLSSFVLQSVSPTRTFPR